MPRMKAMVNGTFGGNSCGGFLIYFGIFERIGMAWLDVFFKNQLTFLQKTSF
jgi:hypothetical protein